MFSQYFWLVSFFLVVFFGGVVLLGARLVPFLLRFFTWRASLNSEKQKWAWQLDCTDLQWFNRRQLTALDGVSISAQASVESIEVNWVWIAIIWKKTLKVQVDVPRKNHEQCLLLVDVHRPSPEFPRTPAANPDSIKGVPATWEKVVSRQAFLPLSGMFSHQLLYSFYWWSGDRWFEIRRYSVDTRIGSRCIPIESWSKFHTAHGPKEAGVIPLPMRRIKCDENEQQPWGFRVYRWSYYPITVMI